MQQSFYSQENYWLNINKPYGYSSAKVVAIVKRITKAKKVGHGGTLDPLATGILPIAVNKATKTSDYILNNDKKYYFEISWGEMRDSDDYEGKITKTCPKRPNINNIINILPNFIGKIDQIPSKFSAIKIKGQKACDLARKNIDFTINSRKISIKKISLVFNDAEKCGFSVDCSKGTYIRSLSRDICNKLEVCGYVSKLERTEVGIFRNKDTISLDKLKNMVIFNKINGSVNKLRNVLHFMPEVPLSDDLAFKVKNGQTIFLEKTLHKIEEGSLVKLINNSRLIGLAKVSNNELKPTNIFNNL